MQNLLDDLIAALQDDRRLVADGKLLKNKIVECALNMDQSLIGLLANNPRLRKAFFAEAGGFLVFDKVKFQLLVSGKDFLPDSFTAFRNRIGLACKGNYLGENADVVLQWPYKDCVLQGGMTKDDQKGSEVFINEIMAPDTINRLLDAKAMTNIEHCGAACGNPGESIFIRGNNLLALHSVAQMPQYAGKIKLIYIDPPYNTGNDSFRYNDSFNHSTWLTFMRNRLMVALQLMHPEGAIAIEIDNKELHYLKVICDEIFGKDNYRNSIIVRKGTKSLQKQFVEIQALNAGYDTILLYTKRPDTKLPNLFRTLKEDTPSQWNNHWRGTDRPTMRYEIFGITPDKGQWRWQKQRSMAAIENYSRLTEYIKSKCGNQEITDSMIDQYYGQYMQEHGIETPSDMELLRLSRNGKPEHYIPPHNQVLLSENWMDLNVAGHLTDFEHEKNEEIPQRLIEWLTKPGDLVMDFFLGSGTTAAVAIKCGRRFVGVEQMTYDTCDPLQRLKSVAGSSSKYSGFTYMEIRKTNQWLSNRIAEADNDQCNKIMQQLTDSDLILQRIDSEKLENALPDFMEMDICQKKDILHSIINKNMMHLNLSEIEDKDYNVPAHEIAFNKAIYGIG